MKMQKQAEEAEAELKAMEERQQLEKKSSDEQFDSHRFTTSDDSLDESADSFQSSEEKNKSNTSKDGDAEKDNEEVEDPGRANAELADEMLAQKALLKKKREDFINSMDPSMSQKMRDEMLEQFD